MSSQLLQDVQYYDKYSRFNWSIGVREDWEQTVDRVVNYLWDFVPKDTIDDTIKERIRQAILNKEIMPSMRNLAMAGAATHRTNVASYNCSYLTIDSLEAFKEAVHVLMAGTGLGYSVEERFVSQLPDVSVLDKEIDTLVYYTIPDTTEGWAEAIYMGIAYWMWGMNVEFDFSQIRPAGTPLKTKGGRAAGSDVLKSSLENIRTIILSRQGKKLRTIDAHDIMCHIAKCIVSGGVRRSAMICLFDKNDHLMLTCKNPDKIEGNEQRYLSNNSAVFNAELSYEELSFFMNKMFDSGMGEPGIFSRYAVKNTLPERREYRDDMGTNPCGEIVLRGDGQFCNLSSVVLRPNDTKSDIVRKVALATIVGTIQSKADYFPHLRDSWKKNQQEERLLGVDLNGIADTPQIEDEYFLRFLRNYAVSINKYWAEKIGINQASAVTCIKPSGNSSVMLDTSPGLHTRWSDYYIRRIQLHKDNPILQVLEENGVPTEPSTYLPDTFVASFPVKSPDGTITNGGFSAIEQLNRWKLFKLNWCEHTPSCTITYREDERDLIIDWLYENQDIISGLSFLPYNDHKYQQAPYEAITPEQYYSMLEEFPEAIDWNRLHELELGVDTTNATTTAACEGDKCLITF